MGDSVVGVAGTGADGSKVSPVIVGGLDSNGVLRPLLVDNTGLVQTTAVGGITTVQTGVPTTTYITPLVYDNTAVTGGLYAWVTNAYVKVGPVAA